MNLCVVCSKESKYKCPTCLLLTCSLECTKSHNCSTGKGEHSSNRKPNRRNSVKYVGRNKIDIDVITGDCHFLDTVSNRLESTSRSFLKPLITDSRNRKIKKLCISRKINLVHSPVILKRYKTNKTSIKNSRILWTIEWSFLKQQLNFIDHNFDEHSTLEDCYNTLRSNLSKSTKYKGLSSQYTLDDVFILLRHIPAKSNSYKYYKCNLEDSILKNLENLTVSDFPTFYVISKGDLQSYEMYVYTPFDSPRIEKTHTEASTDPGKTSSKDSTKEKE